MYAPPICIKVAAATNGGKDVTLANGCDRHTFQTDPSVVVKPMHSPFDPDMFFFHLAAKATAETEEARSLRTLDPDENEPWGGASHSRNTLWG